MYVDKHIMTKAKVNPNIDRTFQTDVQLGQTIYVMLNTFYGEGIIKAQVFKKNGATINNRIESRFVYKSFYNMIEIPIDDEEEGEYEKIGDDTQ